MIPYQTAQEIFKRGDDIDQIDIVTIDPNPDSETLAELRKELQDLLGEDYSVTYPSGQGERMTQMLQNYQIGLNFMSGIALFVGAFLIYNAFAMTVVERTREFGLLRTIGMSRQPGDGAGFHRSHAVRCGWLWVWYWFGDFNGTRFNPLYGNHPRAKPRQGSNIK